MLIDFKLAAIVETDQHKIAFRLKQIQYGKNTVGYDNYITAVPRNKRYLSIDEHPRTPDPLEIQSKRAFDGRIRVWRKALHNWDNKGDAKLLSLSSDPTTVVPPTGSLDEVVTQRKKLLASSSTNFSKREEEISDKSVMSSISQSNSSTRNQDDSVPPYTEKSSYDPRSQQNDYHQYDKDRRYHRDRTDDRPYQQNRGNDHSNKRSRGENDHRNEFDNHNDNRNRQSSSNSSGTNHNSNYDDNRQIDNISVGDKKQGFRKSYEKYVDDRIGEDSRDGDDLDHQSSLLDRPLTASRNSIERGNRKSQQDSHEYNSNFSFSNRHQTSNESVLHSSLDNNYDNKIIGQQEIQPNESSEGDEMDVVSPYKAEQTTTMDRSTTYQSSNSLINHLGGDIDVDDDEDVL